MVSGIDSALSGLISAGNSIQASANAIATQTAKPAAPPPTDNISLSSAAASVQPAGSQDVTSQLVNLDTATYSFKANLISLKVQNETEQSLLDIKS